MGRYRKLPVEIEATQWFKNGDHPEDNVGETLPDPIAGEGVTYERLEGAVVRFYRDPDDDGERPCERCGIRMHEHGWIDTLEGGHNVCPGDWIITGVAGERYPCKPAIFAETYEPARCCRECGCSDDRACVIEVGTTHRQSCHWVTEDLCSACIPGASPNWIHPVEEAA
jgi:hypothetical protein